MKKYLISVILLLLLCGFAADGQDSILHRIIFIGDAGEMNKLQLATISDAASRIIPGKTTVMYLGDNIYPYGMALTGSAKEEETQKILQSQYQPMRNKGAAVYFIPGNHDWDKSGKNGLAKIKRQWEFLDAQKDPMLKLVPANGCPDPVEINVADNLTIIAFDSEWWLFPFSKANPDADCDCTTKDEVVTRLGELLYKNRFKIILLASHHPFQSYGVHGGYFSFKNYLFPLTSVNKNLYIPMPVIGTLYPLLRKSFTNPEDLHHPLYKDMIRKIDKVFDSFPNLVHVAGHEHGLQLIKNKQLQVVSGAGAKTTNAAKKKYSLFADATQGYVIVDLLPANATRFTFYNYKNGIAQAAFTYTQAYQDIKVQEDLLYNVMTADSVEVKAHGSYDDVSRFHRRLFGENYRKEWATSTKLPVIKISVIKGGLTPLKRGGGHQTLSLRLKDKDGKEWVMRSIEKYPDVILPEQLRETFARDIVRDAMTAQHPYAPLVVPVLADAVNVPHANPVIGYVAPDKQLGIYQKTFANRVCLLEEREPLGNTDNTSKMLDELNKDNDNTIDTNSFFRARLLDLFLGDWDRHEDQWRWMDAKKGDGKKYIGVPRDRDQALYRGRGFFPWLATRKAFVPYFRGFRPEIKFGNHLLMVGRNLDNRFLNQLDHAQWMKTTNDFIAALTDSVLEASLRKLPQAAYQIRHDDLLSKMKQRRDNVPGASEKYFFFLNKIADVRVSDKSELVEIVDGPDGGLSLIIHKLSKERKIREQLYSKNFLPSATKEIRIFIGKGDDSIVINTRQRSIKLRIIGGEGGKDYNVVNARKRIQVYEQESNASFKGMTNKIRKHLSDDTANVSIRPTNRYNLTVPIFTAGLNLDDGFLMGVNLKHIQQGFRKSPYASIHHINTAYAFATYAFRISYRGEWLGRPGKADFLLLAFAKAPDNTQNFFGRGNETEFDKTGDYKKYYRSRFSMYQVVPGFRWRGDNGSSFSMGPSFQFYHYDPEDNTGRLTSDPSLIGSYDSSTIDRDKSHLGLVLSYTNDKKNNKLFTTWGFHINIRVQGFMGLNTYSKSFVQIIPEIALYKPLNAAKTIILTERLGGGVSFGKTTFYQSLFIGGHDNLLGYRQYRFAGQHSFYNNLELRVKLTEFASYILPGQFGFTGLFDIGRVWENKDNSGKFHKGVGGGFYFTPAQLVVLQIVASYSNEGWYPYFTMGFRF